MISLVSHSYDKEYIAHKLKYLSQIKQIKYLNVIHSSRTKGNTYMLVYIKLKSMISNYVKRDSDGLSVSAWQWITSISAFIQHYQQKVDYPEQELRQ